MSWVLFIDESGIDMKQSPYEVLAGVAVEDKVIWKLTRKLSKLEEEIFGTPLFETYNKEAKAIKLLKRKVFKHAEQMSPIEEEARTNLARAIIRDGNSVARNKLTALAQAKIHYCESALNSCKELKVKAFASIVPKSAPRPESKEILRKDYSYLFQRFYYYLKSRKDNPMGYLVFDERDKIASHILLTQVGEYFKTTLTGKTRSQYIIPAPFFVHSDLTKMVQIADLVAYITVWGLELPNMREPRRRELSDLAGKVLDLEYVHRSSKGDDSSFKVISDLRPKNERT